MNRRYNLKKLIMTKNRKVFDTTFLFPHVECYFIEEDKLYTEQIDGTELYMGKVVAEASTLEELEELAGKVNG